MVVFYVVPYSHNWDGFAVSTLFECAFYPYSCRTTTRRNYRAAKCVDRVVYGDLFMVTDVTHLDLVDGVIFVIGVHCAGDIFTLQGRRSR